MKQRECFVCANIYIYIYIYIYHFIYNKILFKACSCYNVNSSMNTTHMRQDALVSLCCRSILLENKVVKYVFCSNKTLKLLHKTEVKSLESHRLL